MKCGARFQISIACNGKKLLGVLFLLSSLLVLAGVEDQWKQVDLICRESPLCQMQLGFDGLLFLDVMDSKE